MHCVVYTSTLRKEMFLVIVQYTRYTRNKSIPVRMVGNLQLLFEDQFLLERIIIIHTSVFL